MQRILPGLGNGGRNDNLADGDPFRTASRLLQAFSVCIERFYEVADQIMRARVRDVPHNGSYVKYVFAPDYAQSKVVKVGQLHIPSLATMENRHSAL